MTGNRHPRRHQHGMQTPGFGCGDGGRQNASLTGWNASEKGYKGGVMSFVEFWDRDPIPKWDFQEPGARLKPWLRKFIFWRHDTSTPVHKQGVKLHKALHLGTIGRGLADQFSEDQICSGQGFDLSSVQFVITFDRIWRQNQKYRQKLLCTNRRGLQKERLWNTRRESATNFVRWKVVSKTFFRLN